jgi:hypothetical protein
MGALNFFASNAFRNRAISRASNAMSSMIKISLILSAVLGLVATASVFTTSGIFALTKARTYMTKDEFDLVFAQLATSSMPNEFTEADRERVRSAALIRVRSEHTSH